VQAQRRIRRRALEAGLTTRLPVVRQPLVWWERALVASVWLGLLGLTIGAIVGGLAS
jgi:hypothetical protein